MAVVVLIVLGAILPSVRAREVKYGLAFDKWQRNSLIILCLGSITLGVWLGGSQLALRGLWIFIQALVALGLMYLIGRRQPKQH